MITPKKGDRVSNYLLESMIGSGSFGQVWRARHHVLDELVAIKILTDPQYVRNFRQEGVVIHGLRHANIVRAMDIDPYADPPYLVMELVDGPSLRQVIDQHTQGMPLDLCVRVLRGILHGLGAAHAAGLVHRDVKPANILLRMPHGDLARLEESDVKLTDFGLGKAASVTTASLVQSGSLVTDEGRSIAGTLVYMSPEQRSGEPVDARSDLYSCAVVLFEMLTGTRPTGSDLPGMVRTEVPPVLEEVYRRAYTAVGRRYPSAAAMLEALGQLEAPRRAREVGSAERVPTARAVPGGRGSKARPAGGFALQCTECGQAVGAADNFCIHCGHQIVAQVPRCLACRAFVNRSDRFCIFCGAALPTDVR